MNLVTGLFYLVSCVGAILHKNVELIKMEIFMGLFWFKTRLFHQLQPRTEAEPLKDLWKWQKINILHTGTPFQKGKNIEKTIFIFSATDVSVNFIIAVFLPNIPSQDPKWHTLFSLNFISFVCFIWVLDPMLLSRDLFLFQVLNFQCPHSYLEVSVAQVSSHIW